MESKLGNKKKVSLKREWSHTLTKESWVLTIPSDPPVTSIAVAAMENFGFD